VVRVVALAGGVGGAKLAHGLQAVVGPDLTVVVNTGDDFDRHGLLVCADHDTVLYTLAGIANREWGWGIAGETWNAADQMGQYGEETWFRLGDRDLATHVVRTARIRRGERLTDVALHLQSSLGVVARILPMTDAEVRTHVRTDDGWLEFQEYFVHRHQEPVVHEVRFARIEDARPSPEVDDAFDAADVIVVAPSNPIVSIGPILAVPGVRERIALARARGVPVAAVSPIIVGHALKGPADRMLTSLGHESSALGVARLYRDLVDVYIYDETDDPALATQIEALGMRAVQAATIMTDDASRAALARTVLDAAVTGPAAVP
jgi:LPPG:FO 2-phospho-L-lactate transferase